MDEMLQQSEMQYEAQAVTAVGILATLKSDDPNIKVKSGSAASRYTQAGKTKLKPHKVYDRD
ncbi:MAG: hypothetical protein NHB15_14065 [Methanosarcina barkeri]|nr:hypothetical protein [Methanosarcina sp. ERenArc_MAG2]